MKQYLDLIEHIMNHGQLKHDRTNTGTKSVFGYQMRFNLSEGFPLVTTKRTHLKSIIHELLWFINGETNIKYLVDNDVKIWNDWPFDKYKKSSEYNNETIEEFANKIKTDDDFASKWGDLGNVYGKQWRNFDGVDQLESVINQIKHNPDSRRIIISAWNPSELHSMALPPCHCFMQFYVSDNKLSLQLYQRSGDVFLGIPFNIASYSLLLMMVAHVTKKEAYEFIHTIGDAHIYTNHFEQVKTLLKREPKKLPVMKLNPDVDNIYNFKYEDFELIDYTYHPGIKGKVAV